MLAFALSVLAIPSKTVFAAECVKPEACSSLAAEAAASSGATDPADYIKTWMLVNCGADGYFHGAMLNYNSCLVTKAVEDKKALEEANRKKLEEAKKNEEAKKAGKPYVTKVEFGKDVKAGDILKAKRNETIVITYADGAEVRLSPGSSMKFTSFETVDLIRGKALFMVNFLEWQRNKARRQFEVRTSGGAGAVRGTKFQVNATSTSGTFKVVEGIVEVSNPEGDKKVEVGAGYSVVTRKSGKISKLKALNAKEIEELGQMVGASIK